MRDAVIAALLASSLSAARPPPLTEAQLRKDFEVFCSEVGSTYAYFGSKKTRWDAVPALYGPDLQRVRTRDDFVALLERAISELYDDHAHLTVNTASSPPLIPSGADLWAEWVGGEARISEVRRRSVAEAAGIRAGAVVVSIDGVAIGDATDRRIGRAVPRDDPAVRSWALRQALAGHRGEARRIEAVQAGRRVVFELPAPPSAAARSPGVTSSRLERNVGYIRFDDSLGDTATIAAFDRALAALRDTRALVIDLRETPSGGNSTVARGVLGRFVEREAPYQKHVLTAEERATSVRRSWIELVSPRGPFRYTRRVAVLVGRWTGSMGEGLALGFDGVGRGVVVGGPMAQLLGATYHVELPNSGIGVNVPAERLFHVDGTPREEFRPSIEVSPGSAEADDAALRAAVRAVLEAG